MATLKRDLGKVSGYATIIGILVGAGIFRVTGEAGAIAGSAVPLAYLLFAPIVISTALAYSVFVSTPLGMRPGGAYIHISRTFGNKSLKGTNITKAINIFTDKSPKESVIQFIPVP